MHIVFEYEGIVIKSSERIYCVVVLAGRWVATGLQTAALFAGLGPAERCRVLTCECLTAVNCQTRVQASLEMDLLVSPVFCVFSRPIICTKYKYLVG